MPELTHSLSLGRKAAFFFLCIAPFLAGALGAPRPLRELSFYPVIGAVCFIMILAAAWTLGFRRVFSTRAKGRRFAVAGGLLLVPTALIALLWTGLATPWDATPAENLMRYEVLAVSSVAVTAGLVLLCLKLSDLGERLMSGLSLSLGLLAGAAYLTWNCFQAGSNLVLLKRGSVQSAIAELNIILDVQLFFATVLTYIAIAFAAAAMARAELLSRRAMYFYLLFSIFAVGMICLRGIEFPNPNAGAAPWYETPGFIVGIPAMPWLMPFFLGVVLLRRAGESKT